MTQIRFVSFDCTFLQLLHLQLGRSVSMYACIYTIDRSNKNRYGEPRRIESAKGAAETCTDLFKGRFAPFRSRRVADWRPRDFVTFAIWHLPFTFCVGHMILSDGVTRNWQIVSVYHQLSSLSAIIKCVLYVCKWARAAENAAVNNASPTCSEKKCHFLE